MHLKPSSREDLCRQLADLSTRGEKVAGFDLQSLARIVEHSPEDMVVTVEAGMTLADLQSHLRRTNQWLPVDPPFPEAVTIGAILAANLNGPRRFGYGTIRDHLLGIQVALAEGKLIKAGGRVVKNVAGYDLCKLFVGSRGTLGLITEATFKLLPCPVSESWMKLDCATLDDADHAIDRVMESELTPVVFDLHRLSGNASTLVLAFAGTNEEQLWLTEKAALLGFSGGADSTYETEFRKAGPVQRQSVLPSRLTETIRACGAETYVARAGNGILYYRGQPAPKANGLPVELMKRVKEAYDPKRILPDLDL